MSINSNIEQITKYYAFNVEVTTDNIPYFVLSQNIKYFDLLTERPVFNIFNLLGIRYVIKDLSCIITESSSYCRLKPRDKILSINKMSPWDGLATKKESYTIEFVDPDENKGEIVLKTPVIYNESNKPIFQMNNSKCLLWTICDFNTELFNSTDIINTETLILDLRNNQGGEVKNLIKLASQFIGFNKDIFFVNQKGITYAIKSNYDRQFYFNKIFIITNNRTASSSEILTMLLKKHLGAIQVGTTTEGKLLIQSVRKVDKYYVKIPEFVLSDYDMNPFIISEGLTPDILLTDTQIDLFVQSTLNTTKLD